MWSLKCNLVLQREDHMMGGMQRQAPCSKVITGSSGIFNPRFVAVAVACASDGSMPAHMGS